MAIVTNSIGTASRDYSTIALWEAALPASAVTAGNSYVGQCYNDSEFTFTSTLTIAGTTTDATHTITLTTATGQGFRDNASAATNALRYNQSNGVGIKATVPYAAGITVSDNYVTFSNLQFKNTSASGNTPAISATGTNFLADSCIIQNSGGFASNSSATLTFVGASCVAQNCLIIADSSINYPAVIPASTASLINCTIVRPSNQTANGTGVDFSYSATRTVQNCVIAGFGAAFGGPGTGTTGSNNAIDGASYPSGITGQTSLTATTEFVQPSNASSVMDWRLNSTSIKCNQTGTNAGAPATDIIGTMRPQGTNVCVGVWELKVTGGTRGLFLNSTLSLGAGGSFFADRLAT